MDSKQLADMVIKTIKIIIVGVFLSIALFEAVVAIVDINALSIFQMIITSVVLLVSTMFLLQKQNDYFFRAVFFGIFANLSFYAIPFLHWVVSNLV